MASAWIEKRARDNGGTSYLVRFRLGGRESKREYGGAFRTLREARARREWILGELAQMRVPDLRLFDEQKAVQTLNEIAATWRRSRVDVADSTADTHVVNLGRILPRLGEKPFDEISIADVGDLVAVLHDEQKLARETIRKTKSTLAMVLDFAGVDPNPARDRSVRLPREQSDELIPPTAEHVRAVHRILAPRHRLPLLVLDATGMRVGELEALTWGDVDEPAGRWRVRRDVAKTRQPRWVPVPVEIFDAVVSIVPREDRDLAGQVFDGFGADRFRTALTRACKAAGVPTFSPHDLRHRRATLWHLNGEPPVQAAAWLGHSPTEHMKTYAHATLADRSELSYTELLEPVTLTDDIAASPAAI